MGTCRICGKNFGLMGGGSEPYTGQNLQVCNSCGEVLKKIDRTKNEDTQEVKDLFVSVISMTDDADVKRILTEYSKSVISDSEKLVAITNESKEKAERAQNIEENFYDLEKAFKVTTGYDFEGYQIIDYKGIVSGDIVLGTGFISEFAASWSDAFGTTSNTFAGKMKTAKQKALKGKVVSFDEVISSIYSDNENGACMEILGGVSENYHNTIEHQIIDKLELDNPMDEFDRDNQRKIFELLIVGYSQKDIRKLLEINLYRWKKLMTDMKELVGKYLDECYND